MPMSDGIAGGYDAEIALRRMCSGLPSRLLRPRWCDASECAEQIPSVWWRVFGCHLSGQRHVREQKAMLSRRPRPYSPPPERSQQLGGGSR
mmetsp:Transcript_16238/g.49430  ORF Transcript_16238/g.49430 Transcript_16238/m.49430 type:complete len:91 (-) Transcript_16238:782-1054(-)